MKVLSGRSHKSLAEKIAKGLSLSLSPVEYFQFPDGEIRVRLEESVVDEDVVVVQSTVGKPNHFYMELFFLLDAVKRSGAKSTTVVIPYLGYQRQDHVFRDGEAVSLEVIANVFGSLGVDKVITFDLHSIKIPEVFKMPVVHLSALPLFAEKIRQLSVLGDQSSVSSQSVDQLTGQQTTGKPKSENRKLKTDNRLVLVSPDMGGIRRIKILSEMLNGAPYVAINKNRDLNTGVVRAEGIEGNADLADKTSIIVDDMISTGKTIVQAVDLLLQEGASKVYVFATHPVFSQEAPTILQESNAEKVFVADTVEVSKKKRFENLEILSIADMIVEEIKKSV